MSKKEIEDLLKLGAYGALMDDDKDGEKFCEEDIDKILLSRSTVVRLNNTEKNSSFSKVLSCQCCGDVFYEVVLLFRLHSLLAITGRTLSWTTRISGKSGPRKLASMKVTLEMYDY